MLLDKEFEAKLKIIKQDDETKKAVLQKNTEFKIFNLDTEKYVEQVTTYPTTVKHKSEASGMRFAAKPPWNASRYTRMANRFMTVTVYGQSLWKLFGIRIRHHALESQNPATMGR